MGLKAGRLRHHVQLQEKQKTQDPSTGELEVDWVTIATPWVEIVALSARDFIAASAQQSEVRTRITIRFREDVAAGMRILHRGMVYTILGVLPDPDSGLEYLTLPASEGVRLD